MISIVPITKDNLQSLQNKILEIENVSFPTPWTAKAFEDEVNNPVSSMWALIVNEEFCGYICFWFFSSEIHLMNIAISPGQRRRGLGFLLLAKMLEYGRNKGARLVWLEVRPSNRTARLLYEKAGFEETSRRRLYYRDTNEDAIVMTLSISGSVEGIAGMP